MLNSKELCKENKTCQNQSETLTQKFKNLTANVIYIYIPKQSVSVNQQANRMWNKLKNCVSTDYLNK